jgi:hypothetical protein
MKLKYSLILLASALYAGPAFSQYGLNLQMMPDQVQSQVWQPANMARGDFSTFRIGAVGSGWLQNSATGLGNIFMENGYITDEAKDQIVSDVGDNTLGNGGYQLGVISNVRLGKGIWSFSLAEVNHNAFRLNNGNTLGLILKGNYYYQDQTVSDKDMYLTHYRARELGVGRAWETAGGLRVGGRVKLIAGHDAFSVDHAEYSLYTAPDGIAIDLTADYAFMLTHAPKKSFFNTQGYGAALDLGATYDINEKMTIGASIIDAGLTTWKGQEISGNIDIHFEGVEIPNLFADSLSQQVQQSVDSLVDLILPDTTEGRFSIASPMQAMASWSYEIGTKGRIQATVVYSPLKNGASTKLPLLNVGYCHDLATGFTAGINAYGGGTTQYGAGLFAGYELTLTKAKISLYAASDNLLGMFMGSAKGLSVSGGVGVSLINPPVE